MREVRDEFGVGAEGVGGPYASPGVREAVRFHRLGVSLKGKPLRAPLPRENPDTDRKALYRALNFAKGLRWAFVKINFCVANLHEVQSCISDSKNVCKSRKNSLDVGFFFVCII